MKNNTAVSNNEKLVNFKKTVFGLNEKEVLEYIDMLNNNLGKAHEVYNEKLTEMKSANELLIFERNSQDEKFQQQMVMYQAILEERNILKEKVDNQRNMEEELLKIKRENAQMYKHIEKCKLIESENEHLKKKMTENEAVCQLREQQQEELIVEIESLKQQNKEIVAKFLEERKQAESAIAEKNLKLTQLFEMHRFTLHQTRSTLDKLINQFDESCNIAGQIQIG